jgi:hypothetical protein
MREIAEYLEDLAERQKVEPEAPETAGHIHRAELAEHSAGEEVEPIELKPERDGALEIHSPESSLAEAKEPVIESVLELSEHSFSRESRHEADEGKETTNDRVEDRFESTPLVAFNGTSNDHERPEEYAKINQRNEIVDEPHLPSSTASAYERGVEIAGGLILSVAAFTELHLTTRQGRAKKPALRR